MLIGLLKTNISEILIEIDMISFKEIHFKMLPEKGGHVVSVSAC